MILFELLHDNKLIKSNQIAATLFLSLYHWLGLWFHDHSHGFVEDVFEALLSKGAAFHVLALELFFNNFLGGFFHYRSLFGVFFHQGIFVTQIDFVPDKYFGYISHIFLEFRIPLRSDKCYFLSSINKGGRFDDWEND